jgi:hypothetical protein
LKKAVPGTLPPKHQQQRALQLKKRRRLKKSSTQKKEKVAPQCVCVARKRPEEEKVAPQCVCVTRKRGNEWVFYEEDHSDRAVHKLHHTVEDLMGQIKVRALRPQSCLSSLGSGIAGTDTSLYCRVLKKHQSTESGVSIRSSRR